MDFPSFANFLVCALVTACGFLWLRNISGKYGENDRYLFRAYLYWWLSWLVWTLTWALITFTSWETTHRRALLGLSDLNAILLITVYFSLARSKAHKPTVELIDFVGLGAVIAIAYAVFQWLMPERFDSLQIGWGLCLSAVSTLVVGWAFVLRFETRLVLIIGFIYAFAQPLAFDAIFYGERISHQAPLLDAFKLVLAVLKVIWATIVSLYFTQAPVLDDKMKGTTPEIFNLPQLNRIPWGFYLQTTVLSVVVLCLLTIGFLGKIPKLKREDLTLILSTLAVLLAAIPVVATFFAFLRKKVDQPDANCDPKND